MTELTAFHGKPEIKQKYLARLEEHHRLDHIVQGVRFEKNGETRGCAIGCTLDKYDHQAYETELGIPIWLALLEDCIFEGLPAKVAPQFAVDFLTSIQPRANLEPVRHRFCVFLMKDNIKRVSVLKLEAKLKDQVLAAIHGVLKLHELAIKTGKWNGNVAKSAESAARSVAWKAESVAWSAESAARKAESAARSAESAAWSAESAARSAAWKAESAARSAESAARSAAWSSKSAARSAESAVYVKYAKELLRLLKAQR